MRFACVVRSRIFLLTTATVAVAVPATAAVGPVATAGKGRHVAVEATMTVHRLGSADWQLDIENSTPEAVTITRITWSPPANLKVGAIERSSGGTCTRWSAGFRCRTHLAGPSCPTCQGDDLTVRFGGSGPTRKWVRSSSGGYWEQEPLQSGHAVLIASAARLVTKRNHGATSERVAAQR
jgi:hypothetical protein